MTDKPTESLEEYRDRLVEKIAAMQNAVKAIQKELAKAAPK